MERRLLQSATVGSTNLILRVTDNSVFSVRIENSDIQVVLNPNCEEGVWIEVKRSRTFGLTPTRIEKLVIYTPTYESREEWRKAILEAKKNPETETVKPINPYKLLNPYKPRPLLYEPDKAIKG